VWLLILRFRRQVLWTYNPLTTKIFPAQWFETIVYHCVDEIKEQPGMPAKEIERSERQLLAVANICFVTSLDLLATRRQLNANTHYFPNVADYAHFSKALRPETQLPADIASIRAPVVGFIGAISAYKVNFSLLKRVAEAHPEWSIVLIGKIGEGEPGTNVSALEDLGNVHFLGPRPYSDLPSYLKAFAVAILPNNLNEYTRYMFPMKFFEYLAAGRIVVATDLPALRMFSNVAAISKSEQAFVDDIEVALRRQGPSLVSRMAFAREQTYERRTERMLELLDSSIARRESGGLR
jgi:glycosyltransferase involved in cell wall biosynthesis